MAENKTSWKNKAVVRIIHQIKGKAREPEKQELPVSGEKHVAQSEKQSLLEVRAFTI